MEVLKGQTTNVTFVVPQDLATAQMTVYKDGAQVGGTTNVVPVNGLVQVPLPYAATFETGSVIATLKFYYEAGEYEQSIEVDVVTPYLELWEVKTVWPEATDAQAVEIEAAVRHVIDAYTGQSFGYYKNKTIKVEAHGEGALRLPQRLINLSGISTLTSVLNPLSAIVISDGWYLKKGWAEELSAIESDSEYWNGWNSNSNVLPGEPGYEKTGHGPITYAPSSAGKSTPWRDDYPFEITGDWGYVSVPTSIKQAARLLVNDYACSEIIYRDRYLESIKAADWALVFSDAAWGGTGNVRADQLLSEYVILNWAVV